MFHTNTLPWVCSLFTFGTTTNVKLLLNTGLKLVNYFSVYIYFCIWSHLASTSSSSSIYLRLDLKIVKFGSFTEFDNVENIKALVYFRWGHVTRSYCSWWFQWLFAAWNVCFIVYPVCFWCVHPVLLSWTKSKMKTIKKSFSVIKIKLK